jgi:NADPH:quinone reductase-like Zn-dependent oxidoreductase
MKAIVWTAYGPPEVLQLREVEKPIPAPNEVLVKIHATTVTAGDCETRRLALPVWIRLPMRFYVGFSKPQRMTILGQELSGEVEAVGKDVTRFKPGDQVFATTGVGLGGYAEYICLPEIPEEGALAIKARNMTFEEAAAVPFGGLEALHFLKKANIRPGEKVLINGAGGTIGTFAVQLAKYYGAEVTAVDSAGKFDMLRAIGADQVIDYTQEDFAQNGQTYDVIFDVIGKSSFSASMRSLTPRGRYLLANPRVSHMVRGLWSSMTSGKRVIAGAAKQTTEDLYFLKELIEAGKLRAVIDRCYPLEQTAEAHRYAEGGGKKGNLVITVADSAAVQDGPPPGPSFAERNRARQSSC